MKVYLDMLGCRLNEAELQTWARDFRGLGHAVVAEPAVADVIVLNTCAVTGEAGRKSRQQIRRLHREQPGAPIVATGCFASLEPAATAALPGVDLVVPNRDKERLPELVVEKLDIATMPSLATEPDGAHVFATGRTRAFLKVQDGCRHRCTFCIVTVARGEERSRSIESLVDEINDLDRDGYKEVVLTGVHLGGYGSDLSTDLKTLVERVLAETSIPRVRLSSLEPWDLPEGFFELWRNPRLMPHLHLPLQSGCDATLKRMGRRCKVGTFRELVDEARRTIPKLTLTTDIIVGFPGETNDEWSESLTTVREIGFGHIHIFSYSPRAGTAATRLPAHVDGSTKRRRSRSLHEAAAEMKRHELSRLVGSDTSVLWERFDREAGEVSGYTENYLRAVHRSTDGAELENTITAVRVVDAATDAVTATPVTVSA